MQLPEAVVATAVLMDSLAGKVFFHYKWTYKNHIINSFNVLSLTFCVSLFPCSSPEYEGNTDPKADSCPPDNLAREVDVASFLEKFPVSHSVWRATGKEAHHCGWLPDQCKLYDKWRKMQFCLRQQHLLRNYCNQVITQIWLLLHMWWFAYPTLLLFFQNTSHYANPVKKDWMRTLRRVGRKLSEIKWGPQPVDSFQGRGWAESENHETGGKVDVARSLHQGVWRRQRAQ